MHITMGYSLEIYFKFDIAPDVSEIENFGDYKFDPKNGFGLFSSGMDENEAKNPYRLLKQVEKALTINLYQLNYWESDMKENFIDINKLIVVLKELLSKIENQPKFYKKIHYKWTEIYLSDLFKKDIRFWLKISEFYKKNGAKKVMLTTK